MIARSVRRTAALWGFATLTTTFACASEENPADTSSSTTAAGGGGAGGHGGGGGITSSDGGGGFDECVSETLPATLLPSDVLIVQDRSQSMDGDKWTAAVQAITGFADNAEMVGLNVGLSFFPAANGDMCLTASYQDLPAPVDVLPPNAAVIKEALYAIEPYGGTPTRPALESGFDALRSFILDQDEPRRGVVILVTDGAPTECDDNTPYAIAQLAKQALEFQPSIRTFAVGMEGADFDVLDDIAEAGGTDASFDVSDGVNAFVDALDAIMERARACEYDLPVFDPDVGTVDYERVVVHFEKPSGMVGTIQQVPGSSACNPSSGGFYYDDPAAPTLILLCPASCDAVQDASDDGKVDIGFECILPPPR
ncbi:MAG: VWA domain-containing protein [Polyangiaceae bacterium]|nr:VWA domain-containing protein [Polyangiaceae bacterium]